MPVKVKKYKICKRLGAQIFEKCQTAKFAQVMATKDAKKSKKAPKRPTDYGNQLTEKQKVRFLYGITETQFRNYVNKSIAGTSKESTPAYRLFTHVEKRLDNVVYRLGFAKTRTQARQMVSHGHIVVNGKKIDVPSHATKNSDVISVRDGSKESPLFTGLVEKMGKTKLPAWLSWKADTSTASVVGEPTDPEPFLNFQAVIEFYSR